jgi:uncharacterized protein YfiM (DUF2279 family)
MRNEGGTLAKWAPVAVWMALIYCLSSQSTLPLPGVGWLDQLIRIAGHFFEYAVLAFLVSRAVAPAGDDSKRWMVLALAWCAVYAVSDEWHQSFVPGRDASVFDLIIDLLGAAAGYGVYEVRSRNSGWGQI